jgi:hypothetical protein
MKSGTSLPEIKDIVIVIISGETDRRSLFCPSLLSTSIFLSRFSVHDPYSLVFRMVITSVTPTRTNRRDRIIGHEIYAVPFFL